MPDTTRFVLVVLAVIGTIYGILWFLSHSPPQPRNVTKPLSYDKLRAL